jgi:hypothetical protein
MNLQEEWNMMSEEINLKSKFEPLSDLTAVKADSGSLLKILRHNLKVKGCWGICIALSALAGFVFINGQARYWLLGMFVVYAVIPNLFMWKSIRLAQKEVDVDQATVEVLKDQVKVIRKLLHAERIWGLIVIPLAGPFGLIMSYLLRGKSLEALFAERSLVIIMVVFMILGFPLSLIAERMNKSAFGKYLEKLEDNIKVLQG